MFKLMDMKTSTILRWKYLFILPYGIIVNLAPQVQHIYTECLYFSCEVMRTNTKFILNTDKGALANREDLKIVL